MRAATCHCADSQSSVADLQTASFHYKPCCESFSASLQPVTSASVHTVTSIQDDGPRPPCITMGSMHVLMMIHAIYQHWQPRCISDTSARAAMPTAARHAAQHPHDHAASSTQPQQPQRLQLRVLVRSRGEAAGLGGVRCVPCKPAHDCGTGRLLLCAMKPAVSVQGCGQRQHK